jgi:hypothetical protein
MIKLKALLVETTVFPLTMEDAQEVLHKMSILANESDLQEEYGITKPQVELMIQRIPRDGGQWQVSDEMVGVVKREMADHIEVLRDIARDAFNSNERGQALRINKQAQRFERMFGL